MCSMIYSCMQHSPLMCGTDVYVQHDLLRYICWYVSRICILICGKWDKTHACDMVH